MYQKYFKRVFDVVVAVLLIVLLSPILLIIAIAIKKFDGGPVLYRQKRSGFKGEEFEFYKFRGTPIQNDVHDLSREDVITPVGRFIRKTSLDELPQVFLILKGKMSFIGPRPWITDYAKNFNGYQKRRLDAKPGITGLAQCSGRNSLTINEKISKDIEYIDNISFKMDMHIIFKTIKSIFVKNQKEIISIGKFGIKDELDDLKFQNTQEINLSEIHLSLGETK